MATSPQCTHTAAAASHHQLCGNYFSALQLARKEAALAAAAVARFPDGSALRPARDAAERTWAQTLAALGREHRDAALLAMAAEAFMNVLPWDYYQVPGPRS